MADESNGIDYSKYDDAPAESFGDYDGGYDGYNAGVVGSGKQVDYAAQATTLRKLEDALLGFILTDSDKMLSVSEILPTPDYFSDPTNRDVYSVFLKLYSTDNFPGDASLMVQELYSGCDRKRFPTTEDAMRYVSRLLDAPSNSVQFDPRSYEAYADQLRWEHTKRQIRQLANIMSAEADGVSVIDKEDYLAGLESKLSDITMSVHGKEGLVHISSMTGGFEEELALLEGGKPLASGVMTGIASLDQKLNGMKGGEVIVLAARPGCGKACSYEQMLITPDGWRKMGDLHVGDYVFDRHGQPTKVLGVFPQGKMEVYEFELSDGRVIECSADHVWTYWQQTRRHNQTAFVLNNITTQEMLDKGLYIIKPCEKNDSSRRNRCRWSIPTNEAVDFEPRYFKLDPYIMGVFLGDGCKNKNGDFELSSNLEPHVAYVSELLGAKRYRKKSTGYSWYFYKDKDTSRRLKIDDLDPKYAQLLSNIYCHEKFIPTEYLMGSIEQRLSLLQGLLDTDGTISDTSRAKVSFSTTSTQLALDVQQLARSLGMSSTISIHDRRGKTHKGANGKTYIRKNIEHVVQILCDNSRKPTLFRLPTKKAIAEKWSGHPTKRHYDRVQVKDIRRTGRFEEMVCILVDNPEHLFLVGDYVVTHNTALSLQIAANIASQEPKPDADGGAPKRNAVLYFSLEMMEDQLVSRLVATRGRVNMQQFNSDYRQYNEGSLDGYGEPFKHRMKDKLNTQLARARVAAKHVKDMPLYATTETGLSANSMKSMVMQKKREIEKNGEKLSLIIIDYLQLMTPTLGKSNASRTEEVGDMSRRVKLLAKEFDVPVLLLAQLNRDAETNEAPNLKHLRESGSIEQDADKVIFIWNEFDGMDENDFQELPENSRKEALSREKMKAKINVAKNRQGEQGNVDVLFDKGFQTFISQSDEMASGEETFAEFCAKYYQKTRSGDDIFWPIKPGDLPDDLEEFRSPDIRELDWLLESGELAPKCESRSEKRRTMTIQSASAYGAPTSPNAPTRKMSASEQVLAELDRSKPSPLPEIDDLASGFEEFEDDDDDDVVVDSERGDIDGGSAFSSSVTGDVMGSPDSSDELGDMAEELGQVAGVSPSAFDDDDDELDLDMLDELERASEGL